MKLMNSPTGTRCIKHHPEGVKFNGAGYNRLINNELYILPEDIAINLQKEGIVEIIVADDTVARLSQDMY